MSNEKSQAEILKEQLFYDRKNAAKACSADEVAAADAFCEGYKAFLNRAKTEREATAYTVQKAQSLGFVPFDRDKKYAPGEKVYFNNRGKSIILAVIGKKPLSAGVRLSAAHIDSPRLDLKQNPLYEDSEMALFKTHYYGGIKKYQWTSIPLSLHGVIVKKDGTSVTVNIGEDETDPQFVVTDLLPHLAAEQMKRTLSDGIRGEELNILVGSRPFSSDEGAEQVKLNILHILFETSGMTESDFLSAELEAVPAFAARDIGLDRSMIGAYGHDDRVCAYAEIEPLLTLPTPKHTAVCILADKEEIGSVGISGMQSQAFEYFMGILCDGQGVKLSHCFQNSFCLSADVSNAFDPNFPETCDRRNNSMLNYGISICKYTGSRGKGGASDASAEAMYHIRKTFEDAGVRWQIATLGKVDQGGGGTVAAYMANRNIVTVDAGVPVLCMHAPMELVSKYDCYMTMLACRAIYLA